MQNACVQILPITFMWMIEPQSNIYLKVYSK